MNMEKAIRQEIRYMLENSDIKLNEEQIERIARIFMESDYVGDIINTELMSIIEEVAEIE